MQERDKDIKISVIIPFRNSGRFIGQCCKSLFGQTMKEVEYIFVDDGSTDLSLSTVKRVLESYPSRKGSVKIISHPTSQGVANSRQEALDIAKGEYIIHCDSDDYLDLNAFYTMYNAAINNKADIVAISFIYESRDSKKTVTFRSNIFPSLNETPFDTLHFSLCNKIIRRDLIERCCARFFEGIDCWEDLGFMTQLLVYKPKITILSEAMYHYRRGQSATLTTGNMERVLNDHIKMAIALEKWFTDDMKEEFSQFLNLLKFSAKIKYARKGTFDLVKWKTTFPEVNNRILSFKTVPILYRLLFVTVNILPLPICRMFNKMQKQ